MRKSDFLGSGFWPDGFQRSPPTTTLSLHKIVPITEYPPVLALSQGLLLALMLVYQFILQTKKTSQQQNILRNVLNYVTE